MQKRRPEQMREDEVLIRFEDKKSLDQAKKQLKQADIKFRVSSRLRLFLPDSETKAKVIELFNPIVEESE